MRERTYAPEEIAKSLMACDGRCRFPCKDCVIVPGTTQTCWQDLAGLAADVIEEQAMRIKELEEQLILRQDELLRLREENRWISVEERMPEEHDSIWGVYYGTDKWENWMPRKVSNEVAAEIKFDDQEKSFTQISAMYTVDGEWRLAGGYGIRNGAAVTRWRPMPKGTDPLQPWNWLERIRTMGVDELARRLLTLHDGDAGSYCRMKPECEAALENNTPEVITDEHCLACVKAWLLEEA